MFIVCVLCLAFHAEPFGKKKKSSSQSNDVAPVFMKREPLGSLLCTFRFAFLMHFSFQDLKFWVFWHVL